MNNYSCIMHLPKLKVTLKFFKSCCVAGTCVLWRCWTGCFCKHKGLDSVAHLLSFKWHLRRLKICQMFMWTDWYEGNLLMTQGFPWWQPGFELDTPQVISNRAQQLDVQETESSANMNGEFIVAAFTLVTSVWLGLFQNDRAELVSILLCTVPPQKRVETCKPSARNG